MTEIVHVIGRLKPNLRSQEHHNAWLQLHQTLGKVLEPLTSYRKLLIKEPDRLNDLLSADLGSDPLDRVPVIVEYNARGSSNFY